ncbi:origin recognition complex subunit 3 isoform X3 [Apis mellifera]|uniref:Origin recognition complex subunit 3 n=1 Tax=Apis mellifera TaxID=7460 RepID=A0A7M7MNA7_APIME|nr:origin recognition complex subunit 3 isoform X3 [Apis mellifera]|eukprot:XP_026298436.1 origin recognition complex subunit 3 isoform X3 [Apis mellifera]
MNHGTLLIKKRGMAFKMPWSKVKDKPIEQLDEIQAAIVLAGVNVSDHKEMFQRIVSKLEVKTKHIAVLWSRDSNNIKDITEKSIYQLINNGEDEDTHIKKNQCHMRALKAWHQEHCDQNDPLIIILTDFESIPASVLHDFILILSAYANSMKFILIFGVATTLFAIHRSLTYDVTSKLNVQVFQTKKQIDVLSDVLENTVFDTNIPFKLTGRAFQLLTDIFLFYDFSVQNFFLSYKICMIQHFYANNVNSLCCQPHKIENRISSLTDEDLNEIKKLPSIEKHIQQLTKKGNKDELLENSKFKEILIQVLNNFHQYMHRFLLILRCLHDFVSTLPNAPMGKQLREFYTTVVYLNNLKESQEYKECLQLLTFLSKQELLSKLNSLIAIIASSKDSDMIKVKKDLQSFEKRIDESSLEVAEKPVDIVSTGERLSRLQLKEKLLKMSKTHSKSPYKIAQQDLIDYLDQKIFSVYLVNPNYIPGNEIFCFNDGNLAKQHIRGSLRSAIHTGLNNPQVYLNCGCCKLENDDAIPSTLPDLSIIYKLHLESRKLINMYDWLQAFLIIVDPTSSAKEQRDVDPKLQARFAQAVAELEFLGFIKSSRKKTDHVKRLT